MNLKLDQVDIDLTCPHCSHQFKQKLGGLQGDAVLDCPGCRQPIKIEAAGLRGALKTVDKEIADLQRTLRGLGKRR